MTSKEINYDNLIYTIDKAKIKIGENPYGIICSEDTFDLLKKHSEDLTNQVVPSIATISGLKVKVIDSYLFTDIIWVLNKENYEEVEKNGIVSLIIKIAKASNIKLWGVDDYHGDIASEALG